MIKILIKLWIALIPLIIFGVWYLRAVRLNRVTNDPKVYDVFIEKKKRYIFYTLVASSSLVILMLIYFAVSEKPTPHIEINNDQVMNAR